MHNVKGYQEKSIARLARTYVKAIESDEKPVPNYQDMLVFASLREETRFSPHFREHWKRMGWDTADYYYESAKINPFSRYLARIMGFIIKQEVSAVFRNQKEGE